MKKCTFILIGLIISISCADKKEKFILNGTIENVKDGTKIALYDIENQTTIDSAFTKDEKFTLTGFVDYPRTFWLRNTDNKEYTVIQIENTIYSFKSPLKNMLLKSEVRGGKEQNLLNNLNKKQRPVDEFAEKVYDSIINNKYKTKEERAVLVKKYNSLIEKSQKMYVDYGIENSNSYFGLNIVFMNRHDVERNMLVKIYNDLSNELKYSVTGKQLRTFLFEKLVKKGSHFSDFSSKTITDKKFKLSSLKGNYIYLTFWSADCGPCRIENKELVKNLDSFPKNLKIVSFSLDINKSDWVSASKKDNISWINISSPLEEARNIKSIYDFQGIPTSFLINPEGIVTEKYVGFSKAITENLKKLK